MGTVHRLIEEKGRQGALELCPLDRQEIDTAAAYLADEDTSIGYLYSGWCQAALPHRQLPDSKGWQVQSGPVTLLAPEIMLYIGIVPEVQQAISDIDTVGDIDLVIVDTPPSLDEHPADVARLLQRSDFVLVPTTQGTADLDSVIEWMA